MKQCGDAGNGKHRGFRGSARAEYLQKGPV